MFHPVLLCGGSGTRLWPLSRRSFPKQFTRLIGADSLFQATARRLSGPDFAAPLLVTGADYRFIAAEQLRQVGLDPGAVLLEPVPRNTAPAVLAAALHLAARDGTALMLVAPSDHVIPDAAAFRAALDAGAGAARAGRIVTFGIAPTRAETGFGWLEVDGPAPAAGQAVPLARFVEKPPADRAAAMLADGRFLWNSGLFLATADTFVAAFRRHAPALVAPVTAALATARADLGFLRLGPAAWEGAEAISVDHAVMERAGILSVVPFAAGWSDLGGWDAVAQAMPRDAQGNALGGGARAIDCTDSLLRSEEAGVQLVGIGLEGIIAVATGDAVLVAHRSRAQEVGRAVAVLREGGARQADGFARDHRPWGWYETLALADRFQVKRIVVHPGAALSLQSHLHRSEHWIVVQGTARVTIDGTVRLVAENESVYVPLGARHRMENPGKVPMVLIEVQTGGYLGEDDITRYEDLYARLPGAAE